MFEGFEEVWGVCVAVWQIFEQLSKALGITHLFLGIFVIATIIRFIINPALKERAK